MASIGRKIEVRGDSPERLYVTEANRGGENVRRHIARYEFAARHIPAGSFILDCACGSGYGTELLAGLVPRSLILGVDNSQDAIGYAQTRHRYEGCCYLLLDTTKLPMPLDSLDAVVTLETIEHLPPDVCRGFLARVAGWVKPGGVVVASSPMLRHKDGQPYVTSPYHINELPRRELLAMLVEVFPLSGWVHDFYHQEQEAFVPLLSEDTGFCVVVARKRLKPWKEKQ